MFTIKSNYEILISKGDDSGAFPIYINKGTALDPNSVVFVEYPYVSSTTANIDTVTLNKQIFNKVCPNSGLYSFYYIYEQWYLFDDPVNLSDYGLTCSGDIQNEDAFSIAQRGNSDDYIIFLIIPVNRPKEEWVVRKTFYKDGTIISEYDGGVPQKDVVNDPIDSSGNMNLRLSSRDTDFLEDEMYNYMIIAALQSKNPGKPEVVTVVNKTPFYVVDDDFNRKWR